MAEELFAYGSNRITIDKNYCYFEINARKQTKKYIFDRDIRAVNFIKNHIEKWGCFLVNGQGDGQGKHGTLRLVVYQAYRPYGCILDCESNKKERSVYLCDGNPLNLTSANLYVYGDEVPYNQCRRIWHDKYRIWIKVASQDPIFFTEYDPALYSILCNTKLASWYVFIGARSSAPERLFFRVNGTTPVGLHTLVWLYHTGKLRVDDLEQSIIDGCKELSSNALQIDHLRNNTKNNCFHNLALMKGTDNTSKRDMVVQISVPYFFIPVRVGENYRIMCGKIDKENEVVCRIICHGTDELLDFLKKFRNFAKESGDMRPREKDRTKTACLSEMLIDDGYEYHGDQFNVIEGLLQADEDLFTPYSEIKEFDSL